MSGKTWLRAVGLTAGVALLLAATATARDGKPKKDPPGTAPFMKELRALFTAWDLDGDGYLDKEELAKAFRGPKAKPYDYQPPGKSDSSSAKNDWKGKSIGKDSTLDVRPANDKVASPNSDTATIKEAASEAGTRDREGPKKDFVAARAKDEGKDAVAKSKTPSKPDYSQYPDYVFLTNLDKNGDEKISKDEFEQWARDYAVQLKHQADALKRLAKAEERLAKATKDAERRQLQGEVKQEQDALKTLEKDMKAFEKEMHKLMQGKR